MIELSLNNNIFLAGKYKYVVGAKGIKKKE